MTLKIYKTPRRSFKDILVSDKTTVAECKAEIEPYFLSIVGQPSFVVRVPNFMPWQLLEVPDFNAMKDDGLECIDDAAMTVIKNAMID